VRAGLTAGLPEQEAFGANTPITGAEAAVMLQNALDLRVSVSEESDAPVWAESALTAMNNSGLELEAQNILTRGETAKLLYQATKLRQVSTFME